MKLTLKNLTVFLFLFSTFSLFAQPRLSINQPLISEAAIAVKQKFDSQTLIEPSAIQAFLTNLYDDRLNPDLKAPEAQLSFIDPTTGIFNFFWPAIAGSSAYTVSWLNLENGTSDTYTGPETTFKAEGFDKALFLFAFTSSSSAGKSDVDIMVIDLTLGYIIIDKDIFLTNSQQCPTLHPVDVSNNRKLQPSIEVNWNTLCSGSARYVIIAERLDSSGAISRSEYKVQVDDMGSFPGQTLNNIAFQPVTDPIDYSRPYLAGKADAYEFVLTSKGTQIIFPMPKLAASQVSVQRCSCPPSHHLSDADRPGRSNANQSLLVAQPNPFQEATTIQYQLAEPGEVQVYLFESVRQKRTILQNRTFRSAGVHELRVDGSRLPAGMYTCVVETNKQLQTVKMIKVK